MLKFLKYGVASKLKANKLQLCCSLSLSICVLGSYRSNRFYTQKPLICGNINWLNYGNFNKLHFLIHFNIISWCIRPQILN